jgi:SpoVK/Ycf46/Vps4 family AAA+-type ATPase
METAKITANDTIISMLANINADKKDFFYKSAEDYANTLAKGGAFYYRIKRLISEKPMKFIQLDSLPNDLKKLIQQSQITDDNVFLSEQTKSLLDELLIEWQNIEVYKFHNLPVRNKILFHGSTGNGKTTIAKHIAKLSKLPFVEVNADNVIDSRIGSTGTNINNIFNKINEPCILFWDEIDTIGRKRGVGNHSAAGMENERMVNSILVNIEKLSNDVIFIGATNRKDVLDTAFLRRFDVQFELTAPNEIQKQIFLKQMMEYYKLPESYLENDLSKFNSYSEIKMMLMDLARKYVLSNLKNVSTEAGR